MRKIGSKYLCIFIVLTVSGSACKKAYAPKIVSGNNNYLVVEGFINVGNDSTIINLSRTVKVTSKTDTTAELNAIVNVEGSDNSSYPITEIGNGKYASPALNLDSTKQYRIRIKANDGTQYVSDFSQAKPTPPIDSVGFTTLGNGIQLYVNTHDPKNNTHYYRWAYEETWEFHALYFSAYISNGTAIVARTPDQINYYCFTHDASTSITLGSSAKLSQDVIYQAPIAFIPSTSEKIESRYSILLKQYAMATDEYNYWQNLKKNTEEIGSIFDAQPSEIQGNIHCVSNPAIPVIGYVGSTTLQQKRVFIDKQQLPVAWLPNYPYTCPLDTFLYCRPPYCVNEVAMHLIPLPTEFIPTTGLSAAGGASAMPIGYLSSDLDCVDCTIRGTKTPPAFWQ